MQWLILYTSFGEGFFFKLGQHYINTKKEYGKITRKNIAIEKLNEQRALQRRKIEHAIKSLTLYVTSFTMFN